MSAAVHSTTASSATSTTFVAPAPNTGRFTAADMAYFKEEIENIRGLPLNDFSRVLADTGAGIAGGLATHGIAMRFGHTHLGNLPSSSDIDIYIPGCFPPSPPASWRAGKTDLFEHPEISAWHTALTTTRIAKTAILLKWTELLKASGYSRYYPRTLAEFAEYECERTEEGDRIFTSGSKIRYQVLFFKRIRQGTTDEEQTVNIVFVDAPLHEVAKKVDISITGGFIMSTGHPVSWTYHHAYPEDVEMLRIRWSQPEATHTKRQYARMKKYGERYSTLPIFSMKVPELIEAYGMLPDKCFITLMLGHTESATDARVVRLVRGLGEEAIVVFVHLPPPVPLSAQTSVAIAPSTL